MKPLAPTVALTNLSRAELSGQLQALGLHLRAEDVERLLHRLEREPTRAELALLDSMWSEHCSYKSSRALLRLLPTQGPHVVLGPGADAGVVRLPRAGAAGDLALQGSTHCVVLGHESHNHPSQLLPFEGAATGIGGIVRDVYCMGAEVIAVLDALRFGDPSGAQGDAVQQIVRGVVDGIAHYGNALGVPNLGGEVEFDACFDDNCLVNVVALGIMEEDELVPSKYAEPASGQETVLVLVGKPTDDSGLGGAAFASGALDSDEATQERGAVQLPDPFFKRVLTEANREALAFLRRSGHAFAMKDLGAAGLGGAATEMAGKAGLDLDLDAVHTDRPDRAAAVLLVAETQERYIFAIPEIVASELIRIYEQEFELGHMVRGAGARIVGRFNASGRVRATQGDRTHLDLPTAWITEPETIDWPRAPRAIRVRAAVDLDGLAQRDLGRDLRAVLGSLGGGSRWPLFAHYDSDVQGRTSLRPGDADAGLLVPWRGESLAVAIAVAGPARVGKGDGWFAGASSVCEAVRNVVAVGATPWALTDCLNFGSPENPECMRDVEECVHGLADAASAIGLRGHPDRPLPFVSGNVSLYNESRAGKAIPPTPIVACLGVALDVGNCRGMSLKQPGDCIYRVGPWSAALGGSLYAEATRQPQLLDAARPVLDLDDERRAAHAVLAAYDAGLMQSCRDVSVGGTLVAALEMCFGRRGVTTLGLSCELAGGDRPAAALWFAEASGYVCAVRADDAPRFESLCAAHEVQRTRLGTVLPVPRLDLRCGDVTLELPLADLASVWRDALRPFVLAQVAS